MAAISEKRTQAQLSSDYEVHASQIKLWKQQALKAIENDFTGHNAKQLKAHNKLVDDLYQQIGQLHTQINWLKKNLGLTVEEKRKMIEISHPSLSIKAQCQLLQLARSGYYYSPQPVNFEEEKLMKLLDKHYTEHPCEGKIKRAQYLTDAMGFTVGVRRVRTLMEKMGLETLYPKPGTSVPNKAHKVYPYLLKDKDILYPNEVWAADITYIPLCKEF